MFHESRSDHLVHVAERILLHVKSNGGLEARDWRKFLEKVLTQTALAEPHRAYATPEDREQAQTRVLSIAIKELIKKELLASGESLSPTNSLVRT